jgi:hypothetical protein
MHTNQGAGTVEKKTILRVIAPTEEKQRMTSARDEKLDHQETNRNKGPNHERHRRVKLRRTSTSGKRRNMQEGHM